MKILKRGLPVFAALLLAACGQEGTNPVGPGWDLPTSFSHVTPPDFVPEGAVCETITFDDFVHGDDVESISMFGGAFTLTVSAIDLGASSASPAKAYDTNMIDGPDTDLEWQGANERCGPSSPTAPVTCEGQNRVLVIPHTNFGAEGDSDGGGTVRYTGFPTADPNDGDGQAWIDSFKGFDQDPAEGEVAITLVIDGVERGATTGLGDGSVEEVHAAAHGPIADQVDLVRDGSGATDDIRVCFLPPGDDEEVCVGLTPGYWKNWDNHYTEEEFQDLVDWVNDNDGLGGTLSIEDIEDILGYGGPSAIDKLKKFYYANLLTLALTNHPGFPNPDGAGLGEDCEIDAETLGDALEDALDVLDGGDFSRDHINNLKDLLDAFANMD